MKYIKCLLICVLLLSGCSSVSYIDAEKQSSNISAQLSYADLTKAVDLLSDKFVKQSPNIYNGVSQDKKILFVGRVLNDTQQHLDTDLLSKRLRMNIANTGKFVITSALDTEEVRESRELLDDPLFNQETTKKQGKVLAPDYALTGKIIQRTLKVGRKYKIEYIFQVTVSDLGNGLVYWEAEEVIGKLAKKNDVVSW